MSTSVRVPGARVTWGVATPPISRARFSTGRFVRGDLRVARRAERGVRFDLAVDAQPDAQAPVPARRLGVTACREWDLVTGVRGVATRARFRVPRRDFGVARSEAVAARRVPAVARGDLRGLPLACLVRGTTKPRGSLPVRACTLRVAARRMRRMLRIFGRCRGVVRKPGVSSSMVVLAPPGVGAAIDARASGDTTNEDSSAVAGVRWLFAAASE